MAPAGFFQSRFLANSQIFRRRFAAVFRLFVAHLGALIEAAQAGSLYGRDVHKHVLAAVVGLNKSYPLVALNHFTVPVATSALPF
jgi:hypothetical protein